MDTTSPFYTLFSHTADLGVSVTGNSCADLFRNAGKALTDLIVHIKEIPPKIKELDLTVSGTDSADLMVNWLSEILYLFEGEKTIVLEITVNSITDKKINTTLQVIKYDEGHHEVIREIKAVTYHRIEVKENNGMWQSKIIFDL